MANNYTQASFEIPVNDEDLARLRMRRLVDLTDGGLLDPDEPTNEELFGDKMERVNTFLYRRDWLGFDWDIEGPTVWFYSDESIDIEAAVTVAQILLDLDDNDEVFATEWADTCSRPRVGEFGGGAVAFNRHRAEYLSTSTAALELVKKVQGGQE
jgi:hypothetical protein